MLTTRVVRDKNRIPKAMAVLVIAQNLMLGYLGRRITERIDRGFDSGSDALGRPWRPLAAETIRRKGHGQILVEGGEMRESIEYDVKRGAGRLLITSDSDILPYHEFGVPEEGLPRRPVMQPAAIWAEKRLLPGSVEFVGDRLDTVTF